MKDFNFKPVSIGIILALLALLAGMMHGMAFGANEDGIKKIFKANAEAAFAGNQDEIKETAGEAWKTLKRAHYHFMGLGAMAVGLCLFAGISGASEKLKMAASTLVGFGSLVYPLHFTLASFKVSSAGGEVAHETYELVAQAGAGTSFIGLILIIVIAAKWAMGAQAKSSEA
ncbi:MAG: hypothetical protein OEV92_09510 [Nitrospinota bacterium]|nr:hypothetical protein [Nitrospinota bacterium]